MPMEPYRPELHREVWAFCRRLKWPGYVREIIAWHTRDHVPGGLWVWRERRHLAAFCAVRYVNPQDAWLYGMRVARESQNQGIATRFTKALFAVCRNAGRSWAGINTYHYTRQDSPVYRITEQLGMEFEAAHAVDSYWNLRRKVRGPRLKPFPGIYRHWLDAGNRVGFVSGRGWLWYRLLPQRRRQVNAGGRSLRGVPVQVRRSERQGTVFNLFDRPDDFPAIIGALLAPARGKNRWVSVCYPADWTHEFRAAARAAAGLRRGKNYWPSAWRVYGKHL